MADPTIKKIDAHPNLVGVAAIDDKVLGIDSSEVDFTKKTVLIAMSQLSIHTANQLAADVIENTQIKDGSVTEAKLGTIKRTVVLRVTSPIDDVEVINYGGLFPWAISLNNFVVVDARINLAVAGSTNTTVVLSNQGGTMSTLTLASGATGMSASGTIATSYKTAITNGFLGVNVTAAGAGAKGLTITLVLQGVPA